MAKRFCECDDLDCPVHNGECCARRATRHGIDGEPLCDECVAQDDARWSQRCTGTEWGKGENK